jgi:hypothetical protein
LLDIHKEGDWSRDMILVSDPRNLGFNCSIPESLLSFTDLIQQLENK